MSAIYFCASWKHFSLALLLYYFHSLWPDLSNLFLRRKLEKFVHFSSGSFIFFFCFLIQIIGSSIHFMENHFLFFSIFAVRSNWNYKIVSAFDFYLLIRLDASKLFFKNNFETFATINHFFRQRFSSN